jgi:hypothetical protein
MIPIELATAHRRHGTYTVVFIGIIAEIAHAFHASSATFMET